jgi:hypothetical protein
MPCRGHTPYDRGKRASHAGEVHEVQRRTPRRRKAALCSNSFAAYRRSLSEYRNFARRTHLQRRRSRVRASAPVSRRRLTPAARGRAVRGGLGVYQDWRRDVPVTATFPELLPPQRRQILTDGREVLDFA